MNPTSPREEPKWPGPETALTKDEAALVVRLTQLVKRFPSDQEPDDTPVDGHLTVKQACDAREALRNLSRERYWRQWEKSVVDLSAQADNCPNPKGCVYCEQFGCPRAHLLEPVKAASPEGAEPVLWGMLNPDTGQVRTTVYHGEAAAKAYAERKTDNYVRLVAVPLFLTPPVSERAEVVAGAWLSPGYAELAKELASGTAGRPIGGHAWMVACVDTFEHLTHAAAPAQQVEPPEGWKLVPVEPTEAMKSAAQNEFPRSALWAMVNIWKFMLAAAPDSHGGAA